MTAKQLIVKLQALPRETLILVSRDEEGNGFSPLADVSFETMYEQSSGRYEPSPVGMAQVGTGESAAILWPTI